MFSVLLHKCIPHFLTKKSQNFSHYTTDHYVQCVHCIAIAGPMVGYNVTDKQLHEEFERHFQRHATTIIQEVQ